MMRSARTTLAQTVYGWPGAASHAHTGNSTATVSEATETNPESHRVAAQIGIEITIASGARARNTPVVVATPLPPRNRTYGENMCPSTALTPKATVNHAGPLDHGPKIVTGTVPFTTSI